MRENFLHYLWKHKKVNATKLLTTNEERLQVVCVGEHNHNTGPDFFNAKVFIDEQLWAGNIEVHIKSSDWYLHHHEIDKNYDNVILHVVWLHDAEVYRSDNSTIPTLELKRFVSAKTLSYYQKLFSKRPNWINCEHDFASVDNFVINHWLERLYYERLERKYLEVDAMLRASKNNWEDVLFKMLAKNFGLKVNGEAFLSLANSFDFSLVQKLKSKPKTLEALFFGQAELLQDTVQDTYYQELQMEYHFLKQKFSLSSQSVEPLQFFRLRPSSFPTIRLSQLANLYNKHANIFSKVINAKTKNELYKIFKVSTSKYWEDHFTFGKTSNTRKKSITESFVNLLIINTIVPLQFSYAKHQGKTIDDSALVLIQQISSEKNIIVDKYHHLRPVSKTALHSQALIQLKTEYCDKNKCLQCEIGNTLLTRID